MTQNNDSSTDTSTPGQSLSALIASCTQENDGWLSATPGDNWKQGRSLYGGVQAALAVHAMLPFTDDLPIRTLQATLCAPVSPGPLRVHARVLRVGGSTRQIEARFVDEGNVLAIFVATFGKARKSVVCHDYAPIDGGDEEGLQMPFIKGLTPDFLQHFTASLIKGHFPGSGKQDKEHIFRVSLHDDVETTGLVQLLAMSDFPPPIGLTWLTEFVPGSTMTWMLNFTGRPFEQEGLANWLVDVQLDSALDGYTQQTVTLIAPSGTVIARGTQCMVVFG